MITFIVLSVISKHTISECQQKRNETNNNKEIKYYVNNKNNNWQFGKCLP